MATTTTTTTTTTTGRKRRKFANTLTSFVSLFLVWGGASSSIPEWSLTCHQVTYGALDSTVTLACQVEGLDLKALTFYRIKWEKIPEESIVLEKINRDTKNFQSSPGYADRVSLGADGISLQLRNLTSSDFGTYVCEVLVAGGTEFDNQAVDVDLEEAAGPSSVRITGNQPVREGAPLTLTCRANETNPVPELAWYQDGVKLGVKEPPLAVYNRSEIDLKKTGVDVSHTLTLTPLAGDNGAYVECRVANVVSGVRKSHTIQLNVTYPPSIPKLAGVSNSTWLVEDEDTAIVTCELEDHGNPPALLTLLSRGVVRVSEFANRVAYEHTRVTRSDNGSEFVCRAENAETKDKPKQDNAIVSVAFGPTHVSLKTSKTSVHAGDVVILRCEVEGSNPIPRIRWLKEEQPLEIHPKDMISHGIPERDVYGGFSVTKEIRILANADDNRKSYACHAHNPKTKINEQSPLFLDVLYEPTWVSGHPRPYAVKLDDSVQMVCPLAGNPPVAHWEWLLNGELSRYHSTTSRNDSFHFASTLIIPSVTMEELGQYTCRAASDSLPKQFYNFTIDLIMANVPDLPNNCFHNITDPKRLRISCFPGFDGGAKQDFKINVHDVYSNHKMVKDGRVSRAKNWIDYEISELSAGALYSFCAFSCNKFGCNECEPTQWLSVEMPADPNASTMSNTAVGFLVCGLLMLALGVVVGGLYMRRKTATPIPKILKKTKDKSEYELKNAVFLLFFFMTTGTKETKQRQKKTPSHPTTTDLNSLYLPPILLPPILLPPRSFFL